jgi:hypothetical protein
MHINTYFWSYLAQFFLECEMFYTELYRKLNHTFYIQIMKIEKSTKCNN